MDLKHLKDADVGPCRSPAPSPTSGTGVSFLELRWRKHPCQRLLQQFECHTSATVLGKGLEGAWGCLELPVLKGGSKIRAGM